MDTAKKIYAVRQGRKVGLFYSWAECEQQIKGYSGAQYKSFTSAEDAYKYLGQSRSSLKDSGNPENELIAYVDGSYNSNTGEYSAGVVLLYENEKKTISLLDNDPLLSKMRNVAGEIMGSKAAMKYALENNIGELAIYYDYAGIEKWCTGEWQTKMDATQEYKNYYNEIAQKVSIRFVKVKAHSGSMYNEEADKLAREAFQGVKADETKVTSEHRKTTATKLEVATLYFKSGQEIISDKQVIQSFRNNWKKNGRKINEIKKLDIYFDICNKDYQWEAHTVNGIEKGVGKVSQ